MAATKKNKKSAVKKKFPVKKYVPKVLPSAKKAKMGRPATYRYFTATVKFRLPVGEESRSRGIRDHIANVLAAYDGLKVTVSEDKK